MKQDQVAVGVVTHHRPRWQHIHKIAEHLCQKIKEVFFVQGLCYQNKYLSVEFLF